MKYKGYIGKAVYDDDAQVFYGEVIGLRDIITFQGTTVDEVKKAFQDSVDVYLDWCKKKGDQPEKVFSGKFNLRIPPALHAHLSAEARLKGMSLNAYIVKKLKD